jgi:hypothetical protein
VQPSVEQRLNVDDEELRTLLLQEIHRPKSPSPPVEQHPHHDTSRRQKATPRRQKITSRRQKAKPVADIPRVPPRLFPAMQTNLPNSTDDSTSSPMQICVSCRDSGNDKCDGRTNGKSMCTPCIEISAETTCVYNPTQINNKRNVPCDACKDRRIACDMGKPCS